jgi:hypothetical protein
MVYFIADGVNPPPPGRLLYGKEAKVPASGELVALHFVMSSHGTMCAGTIAARGRNVRGIAPEASLIAVLGWSGNEMELCLLTALGYDGLPRTGDQSRDLQQPRHHRDDGRPRSDCGVRRLGGGA